MRQPAIKPPVGYKIYPKNILRTFYGPTRLIYILDPLSILPTTPVGTLLVRNSNSTLWL
jgi:hypothetical protein